MLEWLLKYPPALFRQGTVHVDWSWLAFGLAVVVIGVLVATLIWWRTGPGSAERGRENWRRGSLAALRTGLLALLLFSVLDPVLLVSLPEPEVPRVAVLLDDSLSMGIDDVAGSPRSAAMLERFAPGVGAVSAALESRYEVRYFRYGSRTQEIFGPEDLAFRAARSDLSSAVEGLAYANGHDRPSALVVVGDGGWEAGTGLAAAVAAARSRGIAVHTVGVGSEHFDRDLELADVRIPGKLLRDERVDAELTIHHRGFGGEKVRLTLESDGVLLDDREVVLPSGDEPVNLRLPVALDVAGLHRLVFRLAEREGERVLGNNIASRTVEVSDAPLDVLHVEGEPRFEVKFLRRALADDGSLRLVSLVRTAENKFYRLGIRDGSELAGGFPQDAAGLFGYHALVLGSLEAAALSDEQHALIRDFVGRRGGGLLVLGGRFALAEGGYAQSPLAAMLPVRLDAPAGRFRAVVKVRPLRSAGRDPILRMASEHVMPWEELPALTMINPIRTAKPGATVLLEGTDETSRQWIALAHHRYGRGRVAVFPVRDSWRWQMHSSVAPEDLTHELFWRQLLRWLARGAGERVQFSQLPPDRIPGDSVPVELQTLGADFEPSHTGEVRLSVLTPLGDIEPLKPVWSPESTATHRASFVPTQAGVYEIQAELVENGAPVAKDRQLLEVRAEGREFFAAELGRDRLQRLAQDTGGQHFDLNGAGALPAAISVETRGVDVTRRLPLWDAPVLIILILTLAGAEWLSRRRWGLT